LVEQPSENHWAAAEVACLTTTASGPRADIDVEYPLIRPLSSGGQEVASFPFAAGRYSLVLSSWFVVKVLSDFLSFPHPVILDICRGRVVGFVVPPYDVGVLWILGTIWIKR
jgi:hypothetical protein